MNPRILLALLLGLSPSTPHIAAAGDHGIEYLVNKLEKLDTLVQQQQVKIDQQQQQLQRQQQQIDKLMDGTPAVAQKEIEAPVGEQISQQGIAAIADTAPVVRLSDHIRNLRSREI